MNVGQLDIKDLLNGVPKTQLGEDELICILYNQLCSVNFLHSAGIIHRNLQPSSLLIDSECTIMICDFGMSTLFSTRNELE